MSVNQSIKPITIEYKENITIGGCDLYKLAEQYGTPLYVIDETTLRTVAKEYVNAFKDFQNIKMMYASKSLCNTAISKILANEGFGFDVVSAGEIFTLKNANIEFSNVIFNGNNKTAKEINLALDCGVKRFSLDNFYEAEILNKICAERNITTQVLLRITPGMECHTHDYIKTGQTDSKFGFDLSQVDDIINLIKNDYSHIELKGLHAHIGSQIFEVKSYEDEIDILVRELVRINKEHNLELKELNIGGGLGIKYTEEDNPPSIEMFADVIKKSLLKAELKYAFKPSVIYIEPGRSVISTSGITLYTVGSFKQVPGGKKYFAVDGGMADNPRPSLYKARYSAEVVNKAQIKETEKVTIVGRFCESGDILIEDIDLPKLSSGDVICVYNTGAYNYSMASNYNKTEKPAMILVNNSQSDIIVNRETLTDLVSKECIPDRLKKNDK